MSKLNRLKFIWKNYGQIRFGQDIANLTLEFNKDNSSLLINIDSGKKEICDLKYDILNAEQEQEYVISTFNKLQKIKLPKQTNYDYGGCDGDAWELEINDKKYEGYLIIPEFLQRILDIIKFKDIFDWAKTKLK